MASGLCKLDTYRCISEIRKLKLEGYSLKIIVCMIGDAYQKYQNNEKLTQRERFLLGLRYSEFYIESAGNDDYLYVAAEEKRQEFLKVLNIDAGELRKLCVELCGLH